MIQRFLVEIFSDRFNCALLGFAMGIAVTMVAVSWAICSANLRQKPYERFFGQPKGGRS